MIAANVARAAHSISDALSRGNQLPKIGSLRHCPMVKKAGQAETVGGEREAWSLGDRLERLAEGR